MRPRRDQPGKSDRIESILMTSTCHTYPMGTDSCSGEHGNLPRPPAPYAVLRVLPDCERGFDIAHAHRPRPIRSARTRLPSPRPIRACVSYAAHGGTLKPFDRS